MEQQAGFARNGPPRDIGRAGSPKKFVCSHFGCKKRFTRMEHMQRHALNHTVGSSTCPRCNAHFKRPDLLGKVPSINRQILEATNNGAARHMKRHQQRDLEAGGPGCGNLDTRKRAWKAPDGTVVEKRSRIQGPGVSSSWDSDGIGDPAPIISPPLSDEGRLGLDFHLGFPCEDQAAVCVDLGTSSTIPQGLTPRQAPQQFLEDYTQPSISIPSTQLAPNYGQLEYHPALQPDTASSFNMPYTTALDYNWLFDLQSAAASRLGVPNPHTDFAAWEVMQNQHGGHRDGTMMTEQALQNITPRSNNINIINTSTADEFDDRQSQRDPAASLPASPLEGNNPRRHSHSQVRTRTTALKTAGPQPRESGNHTSAIHGVGEYSIDHNDASQRGFHLSQQRPSKPENPLSLLQKPDLLPQISQLARERLLVVIETAKPNIPNQSVNSSVRNHPLLAHESLQSWLDLFFLQFNTAYPLMHMPTFNTDEIEPLLLLSIILLGATYGDKNAHQLAVCIHDVIRPLIFAHAGFSPRPQLWTLQTILLVECFGKSRAGQKQHDFSHLFHGLLINLIRRSDCQSVAKAPQPPHEGADVSILSKAWIQWAELEQKKRLALLCFMWDTQHAVLFCQSLCMSAFELRCAMPCTQSLWESSDANSWANEYRRCQPEVSPTNSIGPTFLATLKKYLSTTSGPRLGGEMNALGLILVLHGIMSIAWDMQRRDQTSLGVNSVIGTISWRSLLSKAYDRWKVDFDQYSENAAACGNAQLTAEWKTFATAYRAVYHAAQALLNMDFLDVQIYAGARHILGRPVQQQDYVRSSRIVKKWATKDRESAAVATWHAASMLYEIVAVKEQDQDLQSDKSQTPGITYTNLFHVPWCLYLAALTAWAFHHAKPLPKAREATARLSIEEEEDSSGDDHDSSDEIVWDAQREMDALVTETVACNGTQDSIKRILSHQGRKGTHGLVWVVADHLSTVRWGIVHAGVSVLRGLVPTRLINQYEDA